MEENACASAWIIVLCQGFFRRVDQAETILMVGSLAGDEVVGKIRR